MAGDALNDPNYAARLKLSEDPEKAKERAGMVGDKYDVSGFSDKEISMAMQGESFGDKDYARLTGESLGGDDGGSTDPVETPNTPGNPEPTPGDNPGGPVLMPPNAPNQTITPPVYGNGGGNISFNQDNDQTANFTGDNNNVVQNQDMSVNGYGSNSSWKDAWMKDYFA